MVWVWANFARSPSKLGVSGQDSGGIGRLLVPCWSKLPKTLRGLGRCSGHLAGPFPDVWPFGGPDSTSGVPGRIRADIRQIRHACGCHHGTALDGGPPPVARAAESCLERGSGPVCCWTSIQRRREGWTRCRLSVDVRTRPATGKLRVDDTSAERRLIPGGRASGFGTTIDIERVGGLCTVWQARYFPIDGPPALATRPPRLILFLARCRYARFHFRALALRQIGVRAPALARCASSSTLRSQLRQILLIGTSCARSGCELVDLGRIWRDPSQDRAAIVRCRPIVARRSSDCCRGHPNSGERDQTIPDFGPLWPGFGRLWVMFTEMSPISFTVGWIRPRFCCF